MHFATSKPDPHGEMLIFFPTAVAEASDSQACSASNNPRRILENTGDLPISSVKKKQGVTNNKKLTFHTFLSILST